MYSYIQSESFFGLKDPESLLQEIGSPLYVYNERILRDRMRKMKNLISYPRFTSNYSIKANSNIHILKMALEEGLDADAMSPGEILFLERAGFPPEKILFIPNNVSAEEMVFASQRGIVTSLDSLSQLERFGQVCPNTKCALRLNPGVGAGHHEKVITAGKNTKFGVLLSDIPEALEISEKYGLTICGINQHIGSLFMSPEPFMQAAANFLQAAEPFPDLEFVDFGGGFGIPYKKLQGEKPFDYVDLGKQMDQLISDWVQKTGRDMLFKIEPGRFVVAEGGIILGLVHAVKTNAGVKYCGTDIGMNTLIRPSTYGSWHDIELYRDGSIVESDVTETVTVVGNICESGDILAKDRDLPPLQIGDIICVLDAGAYGYAMSSAYNNRPQPAEVLICEDGTVRLIRKQETIEDLLRQFPAFDSAD